ncbi:RES family NAD+ phosphorylase [Paenarthrobacter sp. PH39-S1]|uniref:RES family NAD+ phosphorylase n=1 Tax=Paenarthrobacter sp. PH39-S1 TaxID=3046204 RepID=UPI0024BA9D69|nr:RES family NAD+ phosphorylase [Paenarthrobacter sp. PH39-S1]MDJ0355704.1 RES family NAD+ phosphorylase [Paenarthrobacter sp. PH39-S1]
MPAGSELYRVFDSGLSPVPTVTNFNRGWGGPTRFAFFGRPKVPVLYAAQSEEAAICETILHNVPPGPGRITFDDVSSRVCAALAPTRDLKLAALMGDGLRVLGTEARYVTATQASQYPRTVRWAEAAHDAGFEGMVWMSNRRNTERAYILFRDRVLTSDLVASTSHARIYGEPQGFSWLVDYCASLNVDILVP